MSKLRLSLFLGFSFLVISFFTDATFRFASLDHYDPYYALGAQMGNWTVVILLTLVFFLIFKKGKWNALSFLRWLGVASLLFIPIPCFQALQVIRPEKHEFPIVNEVYEVAELLIMGIIMILFSIGIKKGQTKGL